MYLKNSLACHDIKTVGHDDYNIPAIDNEITDSSLPAFSPLGSSLNSVVGDTHGWTERRVLMV